MKAHPHQGPSMADAPKRLLAAVTLIGAATLCVGLFIAPERAWSSLLTASFYYLTIGIGAVVLLAIHAVSKAAWIVPVKRVAEAMGAYTTCGAFTMLLLLPGIHTLYHWSHHEAVMADPILKAKAPYLNAPFFAIRMTIALILWIAFASVLRRLSLRQDRDASVAHTHRAFAISAGFIPAFALTFSMASFDWLMSLTPHWTSTIFAFYNIAGLLVGSTATLTAGVIFLRRRGHLPGVTEAHLGNLGKLTFGFSTLWAYMWLSQYLLIWYANLPEETTYYLARSDGGYAFLFWANVIGGWAVPFLVLLPRSAKRSEGTLLVACAVLLIARWLDIYLMVFPANLAQHAGIGVFEVAGYLGIGALFVLVVERALRSAPILPKGDPYLAEGLHQHS